MKPKTRPTGHKDRNKQFFEGLSGLANALDNAISSTKRVSGGNSGDPDRMVAARERRQRRAEKALREQQAREKK